MWGDQREGCVQSKERPSWAEGLAREQSYFEGLSKGLGVVAEGEEATKNPRRDINPVSPETEQRLRTAK